MNGHLKRLIETQKVATNGFISLQQKDSRYYVAIPDSILQRDILAFSRVIEANDKVKRNNLDGAGNQGSKVYEEVVQFFKEGNKIVIKVIPYPRNPAAAFRSPIDFINIDSARGASFDIKWTSKTCSFIDLSSFLFGDYEQLFLSNCTKGFLGVNQIRPDSSALLYLAFASPNIDIGTTRVYEGGKELSLNTSMVLLPAVPMVPRKQTHLVGYFNMDTSSRNVMPAGIKKIITKWRLEPKPGDVAKYRKGELVEPQNPIVFYVSPSVPQKLVPYFIDGINAWQHAFEKAGFKNAIVGKVWRDSGDAMFKSQYSIVHFFKSHFRDATFSTIVDPRSGEIIQSHILFSSAMIDKAYDQYFQAAAAIDPAVQTLKFSDSVAGLIYKQVTAHEIGHALGLPHNYAASACVPVHKLRDRGWLRLNGHTPSIMDYARHNYVAQPEDSVGETGIYQRVGKFDEITIKYGYLFSNDDLPRVNNQSLEKVIAGELRKFKFKYIHELNSDPRCTTETLGDDAIKSGKLGIRNLQNILSNLINWTGGSTPDSKEIKRRYDLILEQFELYTGYVANFIGGVYETPLDVDSSKYVDVPYKLQLASLEFINEQIFNEPGWLFNKQLLGIIGKKETDIGQKLNRFVLMNFMSGNILSHLAGAYTGQSTNNVLRLFNRLHQLVWAELKTNDIISSYRQNLQTVYIALLIDLVKPKIRMRVQGDKSDAAGRAKFARTELNLVNSEIDKCLPLLKDSATISHLTSLKSKINLALSDTKVDKNSNKKQS